MSKDDIFVIGSMDAFVTRLPKPQRERSSTIQGSSTTTGAERATKRRKREVSKDLESESNHSDSVDKSPRKKDEGEDGSEGIPRVTEFEEALPPTQLDEEAIKEYEAMKSSQVDAGYDDGSREKRPAWVRYRSSIYVDAFNLALDTVLDEESHLFDEREMSVFHKWRELDYEAQYL